MDPVSLITTVITLTGAVCKSYEQISKVVTLVRNAPKELEAVRSRADNVNTTVGNLKEVLEESTIRRVIEKDKLALKHVNALGKPLKDVERTLDEVAAKLAKQYRLSGNGKHYKVRWQYYFTASDWQQLQTRLSSHLDILSLSMQGLDILHTFRVLGDVPDIPSKDPARTLRAYTGSILENATQQERMLASRRIPSPVPSDSSEPGGSSLPFDERRVYAKKKMRLQRSLLQAARGGDYIDVDLILREGAEADWMDENEGMTALHFAAQYGHLHIAERLLDMGADLEARSDAFGDEWITRTEKGRTPLLWAAAGRHCPRTQDRMCKLLLERGADVNARNIFARTALQEAAMSVRYHADPRATMEVLLKHGAHINAYDMNSWTALTECGHSGRRQLAEFLLANGAQVDGKPGPDDPATASNPSLEGKIHETPLAVCADWSWNEDLICLFLDKGADVEGRNRYGNTMTDSATKAKRGAVLDKLARVKGPPASGRTEVINEKTGKEGNNAKDLINADLANAGLTNADMTDAGSTNANSTNANSTNADLTNADMTNIDLTNADLTNADLSHANLSNAKGSIPELKASTLKHPRTF